MCMMAPGEHVVFLAMINVSFEQSTQNITDQQYSAYQMKIIRNCMLNAQFCVGESVLVLPVCM